jgi:hypothetical protein
MDAGKSYLTPLELGQVMDGATIAEVVASNDAGFAPGDTVWAPGRWQDYAVCKPPPARPPLRKVDTKLAPATAWLGPMGLPSWTAYVGLLDHGVQTQSVLALEVSRIEIGRYPATTARDVRVRNSSAHLSATSSPRERQSVRVASRLSEGARSISSMSGEEVRLERMEPGSRSCWR